jgi:Ca2+-binding EF-hand superfamily protein
MKNYIKKLGLATASILLFSLINANALSAQGKQKEGSGPEGGPPSIENLFKQMDADKDGKLSKAEVKGPLKEDFDQVDANEDGYLTKEELEKAPKPKRNSQRTGR